jgi:hypothetical protein
VWGHDSGNNSSFHRIHHTPFLYFIAGTVRASRPLRIPRKADLTHSHHGKYTHIHTERGPVCLCVP